MRRLLRAVLVLPDFGLCTSAAVAVMLTDRAVLARGLGAPFQDALAVKGAVVCAALARTARGEAGWDRASEDLGGHDWADVVGGFGGG